MLTESPADIPFQSPCNSVCNGVCDIICNHICNNVCGYSMGTFGFTTPTSDILIRPGCSLRRVPNWRLVLPELHLETHFEIYSLGIGVHNNACKTHLQFQKKVKPLPQTPYQASAWSYRYCYRSRVAFVTKTCICAAV